MNSFQYLMGHLPVIGRDVILENLRVVRGSYARAQPVVRDLESTVKRLKLQDDFVKSFSSTYMGAVTNKLSAKTFVEHYAAAIPNVMANISLLEDVISNTLEESLATKSTSYKNSTLLQLTEACDFALSYGLAMINHTVTQETRLLHIANEVPEDELEAPTAEPVLENLKNLMEPFIRVMDILSRPVDDMAKSLEEMPEILVDGANYHTLSRTVGAAKIDPMDLENIANFSGSPLLYWGRRRVEKQNMRHREAQETLQVLKLRKLNLERALNGKRDASIERQIRATQSRIEEIQREIEKMKA